MLGRRSRHLNGAIAQRAVSELMAAREEGDLLVTGLTAHRPTLDGVPAVALDLRTDSRERGAFRSSRLVFRLLHKR